MSDNPEFDKELEKRFGITPDMMNCPDCGGEMIECYKCREYICKEGCEPEK